MDQAGFPLKPFDFRLPGVMSMSCDTHKVMHMIRTSLEPIISDHFSVRFCSERHISNSLSKRRITILSILCRGWLAWRDLWISDRGWQSFRIFDCLLLGHDDVLWPRWICQRNTKDHRSCTCDCEGVRRDALFDDSIVSFSFAKMEWNRRSPFIASTRRLYRRDRIEKIQHLLSLWWITCERMAFNWITKSAWVRLGSRGAMKETITTDLF